MGCIRISGRIPRHGPYKGVKPVTATKKNSQEITSLVNAVQDGRAHIVQTNFGYQVHVGDRAHMQIGSCAIRLNNVAVSISGKGLINANDNMIVVGNIEIPTDTEKLREVFEYCEQAHD